MRFYINKKPQQNGEHELHTGTCVFLPHETRRIDIGEYFCCNTAVEVSKNYFKKVNSCYFCLRLYHERTA